MKTVITSLNNTISANFDKRFGRAVWFCLYDDESQEVSFLENENQNTINGAGTKAAEKMIELKIEKVISGDFGPKAKNLLDKFNIQMVIIQEAGITIERIIEKIKT